MKELYGSTPTAEFGPLALRAIQTRLVATGVSRAYINGLVGEIKRMFRWAVSVELLPPAVYQALATVPGLKRGRTTAREPSTGGASWRHLRHDARPTTRRERKANRARTK